MADWNSLKPLRVHATFMTIVVLALAALLIFTPRHAFRTLSGDYSSENSQTKPFVKASSGLSIRSEPSIYGTLLTTAPYGSSLTILNENAASDIINGRSGSWYKVEYNGITGFAWGNYIEK